MTNLRAKEAEKAAQVFERKKQMLDEQNANDNFFGGSDFGTTTNKQVANILDSSDKDAVAVKTDTQAKA
jgi:hypothetical protein